MKSKEVKPSWEVNMRKAKFIWVNALPGHYHFDALSLVHLINASDQDIFDEIVKS